MQQILQNIRTMYSFVKGATHCAAPFIKNALAQIILRNGYCKFQSSDTVFVKSVTNVQSLNFGDILICFYDTSYSNQVKP
jgi:hypothetical protein